MRLTIVLPSLLACALLAACDDAPQPTASAAPPPQQACNCTPAPAAPAPTAPTQEAQVTHHHHHAWRSHAERYSETDYSESETSEYGYVSDSHFAAGYGNEHVAYTGGRLWVDGFGRAYHADHAARAAGTMTRARLKPWAHYDEDCPDR